VTLTIPSDSTADSVFPLVPTAPKLLQELVDSNEDVPKKLESETARRDTMEKVSRRNVVTDRMRYGLLTTAVYPPQVSFVDDEQKFLEDLKNDKMAHDKLHEGIAGFDKDGKTLKDLLKEKLSK